MFAGFRFSLAGIMVLLVSCVISKAFVPLLKKDAMPVALLGLVQTTAQYIFTYIGIGFTSGTNTSIISACASFFTVLFVPLFIKSDRLTIVKIIGCILGFLGVLTINGVGSVGYDTMFGDLFIFLSTLSTAAANIISKIIAKNRNPLTITAYQLLFGGITLSVIGFACGGNLVFNNALSVSILLWLAFVSAAAFSLWTILLKYHSVSKISVFNLLVPVFGTILSGLMLGETVFNFATFVSLILISAGIIIVNLSKPSKRCKSNEN